MVELPFTWMRLDSRESGALPSPRGRIGYPTEPELAAVLASAIGAVRKEDRNRGR